MIPGRNGKPHGIVYTFYSFKGGVGRTMALANVAALLAKRGYSVLVVDWDLEAPGLERFFTLLKSDILDVRAKTPGIVELVQARKSGESLHWRDCLIRFEASPLVMLSAGRNDPEYSSRLQSLNFAELFEQNNLGLYIEQLRDEWLAEYDYVLVDSRTGVTDIGGICTVHLADVLVVVFTTTDSSVEGAIDIIGRARKARQHLPLVRGRLLAVPVPARDESRTEYERAAEWKVAFAERFSEFYLDWLPKEVSPRDAIELLKIPYIPYWSFDERLPAIEEDTKDPASLGHAYETLARLLEKRLDWEEATSGLTLGPPPFPRRRELDLDWIEKHRGQALQGLTASGLAGFMEVWHFSPDGSLAKLHSELLDAARQAQVRISRLPIGAVQDGRERPVPIGEGIIAIIRVENVAFGGKMFAYWVLATNGDFYTLMSLFEDGDDETRSQRKIWFDATIRRAAEALVHCSNLYKALGMEPNAHIEIGIRYSGLLGRSLGAYSFHRLWRFPDPEVYEDQVKVPLILFRLGGLEAADPVSLIRKLCEPLFVLFDFKSFPNEIYRQIIAESLSKEPS